MLYRLLSKFLLLYQFI